MAARIHPTAIVEPGARLGADVEVGAYAFIGADVTLGDRTKVLHHATVEGRTETGPDCEVHPYALIGGRTQDLKARPGRPGLRIGARNVFREYVSVHLGTQEGEWTVLGDDNVLLAYSHVAHDCVIGSHLVMSSHSALAGHVHVGDHVNIGWNAGIHQFCRIGDHAMVAACSKCVQDVPPFVIADGNPCETKMVNAVGLKRSGFSEDEIATAKMMHRIFYRDGLNTSQAMEKAHTLPESSSRIVKDFLDFAAASKRGLA
ncbi:MAG: acyl-ACP--UDP-N-acetylglucosamine O-acyltransferase [Verrucomicrobia bacterium]|nr:acyl-ACP--UDP-N-acetylglucosamine O-acyltransferase [Verrucomicrobiota bacterium]